MITIACIRCHLALRTSGEFSEVDYLIGMKSEWYPDRYPCPRSGCSGKMTLTDAIASEDLILLEVHELTPQEVFQALQGMGLPTEKECSESNVRDALEGRTVTAIDVRNLYGTNRSVLNSITLDNGHRIFLGSSPHGAVVYRIATPRSHTREVLNES